MPVARARQALKGRHNYPCAQILLLLILSLLLTGCQSEPARKPPRGGIAPQSTELDQCSANMHDLSGYILQYYAINRRLPDSLSDLQSLVDADRQLPLTCPVSNKPYLYYPDALIARGEKRQLLAADPEPSHDGRRWTIVTLPPENKTPLGLWVVLMPEVTVQQFHAP